MPLCNCAEIKPDWSLNLVASSSQAFKNCSTSADFTLNLFIKITDPVTWLSIWSLRVLLSSISTNFAIAQFTTTFNLNINSHRFQSTVQLSEDLIYICPLIRKKL